MGVVRDGRFQLKHSGGAQLCSCAALVAISLFTLPSNADGEISVPEKPANLMSKPESPISSPLTPAVANASSIDVLLVLCEAALKAGNYKDAISLFEKAANDPAMSSDQRNRVSGLFHDAAENLFEKGTRFPDNASLDLSIDMLSRLLEIIDKRTHPGSVAAVQNALGNGLAAKGARFGDHVMLDKGIATLRTAVVQRTFERSPIDWAQSQLGLAEALIASARISGTNEKFDEAIEICQDVMAKRRSQLLDAARTKAQSIMANALGQYGQRERNTTLILGAKNAAQQALEATNRAVLPFEWATTLNYLANANREYSYWTSDGELLATAIRQYNQSLEIRTREKFPLQWAQTQLDLGNALLSLPPRDAGPSGAELASKAYQHSLEVRTEIGTPLEWGMSQNNLTASLSYLLEQNQTRTAEDYDSILAGFRKAASVTTRERAPLDWAMIQVNLASDLFDKWDAKQKTLPEDFQKEMDVAMLAQQTYPLSKHQELHNLAMSTIMERQASVADLEDAIAAYDNALQVYTKTVRPWKWINTIHGKANVYLSVGVKQQDPRKFDKALRIFREEQFLFQRQYDPRHWAILELSVAGALYNIGTFTRNAARLREAEAAYMNALETLPKGDDEQRNEAIDSLAYTKCFMGGLDSDKAKIQEGVDHYQSLKMTNFLPKPVLRKSFTNRVDYLNHMITDCYGMIDMIAKTKANH